MHSFRPSVCAFLVLASGACVTQNGDDDDAQNAPSSSGSTGASSNAGASGSSGGTAGTGGSASNTGTGTSSGNGAGASSGGTQGSGSASSSSGGTAEVECASWRFSAGSAAPWTLANALEVSAAQPGGGVALTATGGDPFMTVTAALDMDRCTTVDITVTLRPSVAVSRGQLFFARATDFWFAEERSQWFNIDADGVEHTYRVDLSSHPAWNGTMASLRLDPFDASGSLVLRSVRVLQPGATGGTTSSSAASAAASSSSSSSSGGTVVVSPGEWPTLSDSDACSRWTAGRAENDSQAFTAGADMCDPGTVSRAGLDDALRRMNLYRGMLGLGPVTDDAGLNAVNQRCAVTTAWNPAGPQAHFPPATSTCFTPEAAQGAGMSNLAWGSASPADAVDQFMIDWGNESTYGHRRWIVNPSLNPVGLGFYRGGNQYGSAMCMAVFGMGNSGPSPGWYAFPPSGPVPAAMAGWEWTFHSSAHPLGGATVTVTRVGDGVVLPVEWVIMQGGYGQPAAAIRRMGWAPEQNQSYRVDVTLTDGTISYVMRVVGCP